MASVKNIASVQWSLVMAVIALGVTTIITQIIFLREFLSIFYGNELVIGITLANWLILTGIGSFIGSVSYKLKNKIRTLIAIITFQAILPITTVFLIRFLKNIVFDVGSMIGINQILFTSFVILIPFCIISGLSFTLLSEILSQRVGVNFIPNVYALESLGSMIGGVFFSFIMIYFFETFQSLLILMVFNIIIAYLLSINHNKIVPRILLVVLATFLLIAEFMWNLDTLTLQFLFKNQEIIYHKDTPYGNLVITRKGEQNNFYENNVLLFSTNDPTMNEEAVHYGMIQHSNPKKVLLISGGISGTLEEILKYDVNKIDYVEINPWLTDIGKNFSDALFNPKVNTINQDARLYIKNTSEHYDVVLVNLPDPNTAQINRYYTIEFLKELKARLEKDAVVSFGLSSSADYLSEEARQVKSIFYTTLASVFNNIIVVAGLKDYFIASDNKLDLHIGKLVEKRNINNLYVNKYYLDDNVLAQRNEFILSNLSNKTKLNEDFSPICYFRQLQLWLSYFEFNYWIAVGIFIILLISILTRLNPVTIGIFTGGIAASSIEVILLIAFQIMYGYVYQTLGIIIMIFMGGLAIGSYFRNKIILKTNIRVYSFVQYSITLFATILPFFLQFLKNSTFNIHLLHFVFYLPTFIIALIIGIEFSIASHIYKGTVTYIASQLYGIDLIGSALGALIVTTFLIPLLGLNNTCYIIAGLNLISGTISLVSETRTN